MPKPFRDRIPVGARLIGFAAALLTLLTFALAGTTAIGGRLPAGVLTGAAGIFVLSAIGLALHAVVRRREGPELAGWAVGAAPAVIAVALAPVVHWDDFMTWLPNAAAIAEFGRPAFAVPQVAGVSQWSAYPPMASLAVASVWNLAGGMIEMTSGWLNVGMLLALPGLALWEAGKGPEGRIGRASLVAALAWAATLGNPSLDWHWVLSGCPDTATGVAVAAAAVLARRVWLDRAAGDDRRIAEAVMLGAALALVVGLKQTGVILLVLLVVATVMTAAVFGAPSRRVGPTALLAALTLVPPLAVFGAWRGCLAISAVSAEMAWLPLERWHVDLLPGILGAILLQLAMNWVGTLIQLLVFVAGVAALTRAARERLGGRRAPATAGELLASIFVLVWSGFAAFMLVAYLGVFSAGESARAAEWFRYTAQVAQLGLVAAAVLAWERRERLLAHLPGEPARPLAAAVLGVVLASVVMTSATRSPAPILGRHWAGVLDAREVAGIRAVAARAAEAAIANGAGRIGYAIREPNGTIRPDQLSAWHIDLLTRFIVRYQTWEARVETPVWSDWVGPSPDGWTAQSVVLRLGAPEDGCSATLFLREGAAWREVMRQPAPPSFAGCEGRKS